MEQKPKNPYGPFNTASGNHLYMTLVTRCYGKFESGFSVWVPLYGEMTVKYLLLLGHWMGFYWWFGAPEYDFLIIYFILDFTVTHAEFEEDLFYWALVRAVQVIDLISKFYFLALNAGIIID